MRRELVKNKKLEWQAVMNEDIIAEGAIAIPDGFMGLGNVGVIEFNVPETEKSAELILSLKIEDIRPENDYTPAVTMNKYEFTVFPRTAASAVCCGKSVMGDSTVYITESLTEAAELLGNGEKVIYLPNELRESIKGFYCTDFWCYPMFRSISESMGKAVPVGTMGLLIDNNHAALSGFVSREYSTPQWYHIVSNAECAVLDETPESFTPIVQMIDNFERNHKLGILYEAKVGEGNLLVCTSRLSEISSEPEVSAFAASLIEYAHSDKFSPQTKLSLEQLCLR